MANVKKNFKRGASAVKQDVCLTVNEPAALFDFLLQNMKNQPRTHIKSLLTHGAIKVDGVTVTKYDKPLNAWQTVTISRAPVNTCKRAGTLEILYEDNDIIAVNKPAGLLSIATEKESEQTAYHMLMSYVRERNSNNRIFVVHRLDRDTSGVLIVAKNEKMKLALQDNWAELVCERAYLAIVEGQLKEKSGTIQSWLKETESHRVYSSNRAGDGLEAITRYSVIRENEEYSLIDVHIDTGRKNQIRVHMKELGHSIAGDKKYGANTNPLKRLALHAYKLEIRNPYTKEIMRFETGAPKSFTTLLKKSADKSKQEPQKPYNKQSPQKPYNKRRKPNSK